MTAKAETGTEIYPGIVVDAAVMEGIPILKGTRIPVRLVVGQLAGGDSLEDIMREYALTEQQIRTALGYAADVLATERVYAVSDRYGGS